MDASHLFRPIAAGDLKRGMKIVTYTQRGDGPELTFLEVRSILEDDEHGPLVPRWGNIQISVRNETTGDGFTLVLKADEQIIATGRERT